MLRDVGRCCRPSLGRRLCCCFVFLLWLLASETAGGGGGTAPLVDGPAALRRGQSLFQEGSYDEASMEFWKAILVHGNLPPSEQYDVQEVFQQFMQCYLVQGKLADGLAFVSLESFRRGQNEMGREYYQQTISVDANNAAAKQIRNQYGSLLGDVGNSKNKAKNKKKKPKIDSDGGGGGGGNDDSSGEEDATDDSLSDSNDDSNDGSGGGGDDLYGKTPEELYEIASQHFVDKQYEDCADIFEISCERSGHTLGPSCANAVYCRNMILDWGFNGTQFDRDMRRITELTTKETQQWRYVTTTSSVANDDENQDPSGLLTNNFEWQRATSVHPHMMLGYPVDPLLKRYATESVAALDEKMARAGEAVDGKLPPLPEDLPFDREADLRRFQLEREEKGKGNFKIRLGFVGSGFNSKAVLYLSHDMFRFFDRETFEVHVFSFGPPDSPLFIKHGMRGADWRERVKSNVDHFHDLQPYKNNHIEAARYIHRHDIHVLVEWDGYARQGDRAQGLFALRPAPLQMLHQEYLGTSGAKYVDYIFTDKVTSPREWEYLYTEKLIYLPNHFFSKGHAVQAEVKPPTYTYRPAEVPYQTGTGSPSENKCMAGASTPNPSFVFCNFNKFLKNSPDTARSWIRILREVPDSMLCLLENPTQGVPYFRKFVHEAAGTSRNGSDPHTFAGGDGDELNDRIHFLPWVQNPFDHQRRNFDFCNAMLDNWPYNGHTVAQDALYAGVPIVTRADGRDMSSRVTASANIVLGLRHLNANAASSTTADDDAAARVMRRYEDIAIRLGTNGTWYEQVRNRLIRTALQTDPMHPYWDVPRYVKNFQSGIEMAVDRFLNGQEPQHLVVQETDDAKRGTYQGDLLDHPPMGKKQKQQEQ